MFDTCNDLPPNTRTRATDEHLWLLAAHLHGKR